MRKTISPDAIANFDSAAAMVRATSRHLAGKDFPPMGMSRLLKPVMVGANLLPRAARERIYAVSGGLEGAPARRMHRVDTDRIARWAVGEYPARKYPAVVLGSSNGAAVHLCAALGVPWLPQTFLVPVRRSYMHPDDPHQEMEWARDVGRRFLDANPDIQLHHMHDPNQDRLMVAYMSYFRFKRLRLGDAYERFLLESLEPGGTIYLLECEQRWPAKRLGERHLFQFGAVGGLEAEEYFEGSDRVAEYLARYESPHRRWSAPEPDGEYPEAEWGFEPALREDVERFAREHGLQVRRINFDVPEDLSPLVADIHREWYRRRRMIANRLMVPSFIMMDPFWTHRTGSVPFWGKFPVESTADALDAYLDSTDPYDEIYIMLFSHGTESAGLAKPDRWQRIAERARRRGALLGVDPEEFPMDFAAFARYHDELQEIGSRYPTTVRLTLEEVDQFVEGQADRHAVRWLGPSGQSDPTPSSERFTEFATMRTDGASEPREGGEDGS